MHKSFHYANKHFQNGASNGFIKRCYGMSEGKDSLKNQCNKEKYSVETFISKWERCFMYDVISFNLAWICNCIIQMFMTLLPHHKLSDYMTETEKKNNTITRIRMSALDISAKNSLIFYSVLWQHWAYGLFRPLGKV